MQNTDEQIYLHFLQFVDIIQIRFKTHKPHIKKADRSLPTDSEISSIALLANRSLPTDSEISSIALLAR